MLNQIQNLEIVKFVAKFITPKRIGIWINDVIEMLNNNTLKDEASRLFSWAIIIIIVATLIDWAFFWFHEDQRVVLVSVITKIKRAYKTQRRKRATKDITPKSYR